MDQDPGQSQMCGHGVDSLRCVDLIPVRRSRIDIKLLIMPQACNLCGKAAKNRCGSCGHVAYCCREHQQQDWKSHKYACKEFVNLKKQGQAWEADVREGVCTTTPKVVHRAMSHPLVPWLCFTAASHYRNEKCDPLLNVLNNVHQACL